MTRRCDERTVKVSNGVGVEVPARAQECAEVMRAFFSPGGPMIVSPLMVDLLQAHSSRLGGNDVLQLDASDRPQGDPITTSPISPPRYPHCSHATTRAAARSRHRRRGA